MKNTECAQSNTISSRSLAWLRQNQSEFRGTLWRTPWRWRWNPASSRGPAGRWRAWRRILWQRSWWLTRKCKWRWKCTWKICSQGRWDAAPSTPVLYFKGGVKHRSKISSKLKVKGNMLKRKERITCISFLLNWLVTCNSNTDAPVTEPACLSGLAKDSTACPQWTGVLSWEGAGLATQATLSSTRPAGGAVSVTESEFSQILQVNKLWALFLKQSF